MKQLYFILVVVFLWACSENNRIVGYVEELPTIYPDYIDVTIPYNIAPLNFSVQSEGQPVIAWFKSENSEFQVKADNGEFHLPKQKWEKLLSDAVGKSIEITVAKGEKDGWIAYKPFLMHVANEPVDKYIAYRLIEPGYSLWNQMGIYQRNLESFEEDAIYENKITNYNCVNCHSFCMQNPNQMVFHMRAKMEGTVLLDRENIELLDTKTDQTISALVYPSWHPSGRYISFSVNNTTQQIHPT
ncbi:MAG: hypothetical protein LUD46_21865 [Parabacteroides sp.]|nr:hypothetical protein [Parabacteroides sp.]